VIRWKFILRFSGAKFQITILKKVEHIMLKYKKRSSLAIIFLMMFLLISCEKNKLNYREINISLAPYIKSDVLNLKNFSVNIEHDPGSRFILNIVIYSYSQGKETISLAKDGDFVTQTGTAEIKALIKIMDGEKPVRAEFVEVSGNSNDELIRNLGKSVSELKMQ